MKILNLYAGVGGNRKLWQGCTVTAVECNADIASVYQDLYPDDKVIVGDAHDYLLQHHENFDFIWSSPPCQTRSKMIKFTRHKNKKYPDFRLYEEIIFLKNFSQCNWVIENVKPYYKPLIPPTNKVGRHYFWSNFEFNVKDIKRPKNFINMSNLKGKEALMNWLDIQFE